MEKIFHDWPAYIMGVVFFGFFIYAVIKSRIDAKKDDAEKNKPKL